MHYPERKQTDASKRIHFNLACIQVIHLSSTVERKATENMWVPIFKVTQERWQIFLNNEVNVWHVTYSVSCSILWVQRCIQSNLEYNKQPTCPGGKMPHEKCYNRAPYFSVETSPRTATRFERCTWHIIRHTNDTLGKHMLCILYCSGSIVTSKSKLLCIQRHPTTYIISNS